MGVALWLGCGVAAFLLARIVPIGRRQGSLAELMAAIVTAMLFGVIATAVDFGGWKEMDWRAGVFALLGGLAAVGSLRAVRGAEPAG